MHASAPLIFTVAEMTCGHCAGTITGAILAEYPAAATI